MAVRAGKYSVEILQNNGVWGEHNKMLFASLEMAVKEFNRMLTYMHGFHVCKEVAITSQITGEILLSENLDGEHYSKIPERNIDKIETVCEKFALNMYKRGMLPAIEGCSPAEIIYLESLNLIQAFKLV